MLMLLTLHKIRLSYKRNNNIFFEVRVFMVDILLMLMSKMFAFDVVTMDIPRFDVG